MLPPGLSVEEAARRADLTDRTVDVSRALAAAASFCATHTSRTLSPTPEADTDPPTTVTVRPHGSRYVRVPDLRRLQSLTIDGQPVDVADVELLRRPNRPDVPAHKLRVPVRGRVAEIVGWWGFSILPDDLADSIYDDAVRRVKDHTGGFPDGLAGGDNPAYPRALSPRVFATYTLYKVDDQAALV